MRVYLDSSALIKRSVEEAESDALVAALDDYFAEGANLMASSLAWIEVSRALGTLADEGQVTRELAQEAIEVALSGVAERPITEDVVSLARRIGPPRLRALDAIHLSTAILLDADLMVVYDDRLADACLNNALTVRSP